jgi:hypothetical protein
MQREEQWEKIRERKNQLELRPVSATNVRYVALKYLLPNRALAASYAVAKRCSRNKVRIRNRREYHG